MTEAPLTPEQEIELARAIKRSERREKRNRMQAKWNRGLGMYIDEIEEASQ